MCGTPVLKGLIKFSRADVYYQRLTLKTIKIVMEALDPWSPGGSFMAQKTAISAPVPVF